MVIMNLEKIFNPKSVALIGASDEEGSVGFTLTKNLVEGHEGKFYLVNIKKPQNSRVQSLPNREGSAWRRRSSCDRYPRENRSNGVGAMR
jgi:hypothetical protein